MERRTGRGITFSAFQYLQTACLVESGRFEPRIRNGNRQTSYLHVDSKSILRLCGLSDSNLEFAGFIPLCQDSCHLALGVGGEQIAKEGDYHLED